MVRPRWHCSHLFFSKRSLWQDWDTVFGIITMLYFALRILFTYLQLCPGCHRLGDQYVLLLHYIELYYIIYNVYNGIIAVVHAFYWAHFFKRTSYVYENFLISIFSSECSCVCGPVSFIPTTIQYNIIKYNIATNIEMRTKRGTLHHTILYFET